VDAQRRVLIDTDTASDDAVAIIMALRSPHIQVVAITVVAGNVGVAQGTRNALYAAELCGSDVRVYMGANRPLLRELQTADWFHGADGLGDHGYSPVHRTAEPGHAVDAIIEAVLKYPGLEIVTLGPLTNIAMALEREPRIVGNVSRCVVMGGAPCCEGNVTPAAEFNVWVDPDAARKVFLSGLPIEMIGWQLSRFDAVINKHEIAAIEQLQNPLAEFAIRCNSTAATAYHMQTGEFGISLPDPIAMAILLDPELSLDSSMHFVDIETASDLTRGMTVVDRLNVSGDARNHDVWNEAVRSSKIKVCWTLNVAGWKSALMKSLT
jgi:purine nucleosidase